MQNPYDTYRPPGFSTVSPYLMVSDAPALIEFYQRAFAAVEIQRTVHEGTFVNAIIKIGETCFMIGRAQDEFGATTSTFYLYVNDVDAMFQRSVDAGAEIVFEPADMPYKDRQAGVKDPAGNSWWISSRLEEAPYSND